MPRRVPHHGVEIRVVEVGATWRGVTRRAEAVNLRAGEVRGPRSHHKGPSGSVRLPNRYVKLPIIADFGVCFQKIPTVERNDVGIDLEGDYGSSGFRKLLHYKKLRAPVLEEKKEERVPDDALQHHHLHHEFAGVFAVHGDEQRDPHHERVRQCGEGENRNHPLQAPVGGEVRPDGEGEEHDDFLERVRRDEPEVHLVRVVHGDEVEREERNGEDRDEAVYAGALVR